jgi:hypothetical protein
MDVHFLFPYLSIISIVKISINLTKHNEKSMLEAVNGEDMRASSEISLLFYREIALGRAVVVDPLQVGLIWVLMRQKCLESE